MAEVHQMKRGDLLPVLSGHARDPETGDPVDLTGASLRFLMRARGAAQLAINATIGATIINATQGQIAYVWQASETNVVSLYEAEFEAKFPGASKPLSIPNRGYIPVRIDPDLG